MTDLRQFLLDEIENRESAGGDTSDYLKEARDALEAHDALVADRDRLAQQLEMATDGLEFYAIADVYKPHPHGPAFDNRDLSYHARIILDKIRRPKEPTK